MHLKHGVLAVVSVEDKKRAIGKSKPSTDLQASKHTEGILIEDEMKTEWRQVSRQQEQSGISTSSLIYL